MEWRFTAALVVACAIFVSLPAGSAQAKYEGEYLGVSVQAMVKRGFAPETWPGFLGTAREGGFAAVRHDAGWAHVESTAPQGGTRSYRWDSLDRFVTATARSGLRWTPVLSVVPDWARDADGRFTSSHYADFVAFASALTRRYGTGGEFWRTHPELPALPVNLYEVWNEPNSANAWNGRPEPAAYAALFAQMRDAVKGVDPGANVVVSLGWQNPSGFIDGLARSGNPAWAGDGIAFHPYAPTPAGIVVLMRNLHRALAAHGRSGTPLYVNEIGWPRAFAAPATHAWDGLVSDATRAASLSIVGDALQRSDCGVRMFAPYSLVEPEEDTNNVEDWMGILHRDGSPTAAFTALRAAARRESPAPAGRLAVCGEPGSSDTGALLPLSLQASRATSACDSGGVHLAGEVRYAGNPLEQATLTAYRDDRYRSAETDSSGRATVCAPAGSGPIELQAGIRDVGVSPVLVCSTDRPSCSPVPGAVVGDGAGGPETGTGRDARAGDPATGGSKRCGVRLVAPRTVRVRRGRARVRVAARDACAPLEPRGKVRVRVHVAAPRGRPRFARSIKVSRRSRMLSLPVRARDRRIVLAGRAGGSKARKITLRIRLRHRTR